MRHFTNKYPGPNRITIRGDPSWDSVTVCVFGQESYTTGYARRFRAFGSGNCAPCKKIKIERGTINQEEFLTAIKNTCVELAEKYRRPVVDGGIWGFYYDQETPFDDEPKF